MFKFLRSKSKAKAAAARQCAAGNFRPRLEVLEDRCLLSGGILVPSFGSGGVAGDGGLLIVPQAASAKGALKMWFPSFLRSRTGSSKRTRFKLPRPSPGSRRATPPLHVEQLEHRWCPSYSLISNRAALAGTDSVNWGNLGPSGTLVANPFTILSGTGLKVTVSKTITSDFEVLEEEPPVQARSWVGNFAPGDMVLYTEFGRTSNPITLNFGTTAVAAGGAQIQPNGVGNFTAEVDALNASGKILASFTEVGNSTTAENNSAIFIGISSSSANIYQIALSIVRVPGGAKGDFAINQFDFRTSAAPTAPVRSQRTSAGNTTVLASSLHGTRQQSVPAGPVLGLPAPPAARLNPTALLPTSGTATTVSAEVADAVFAGSQAATEDGAAWLFAPFPLGCES